MHPQPGPLAAPLLGPALRVGEIDEVLAGEERAADELHLALHPRLVLRGTNPRRVDLEPAGLRVLDERLVQAGARARSAPSTTADMLSGINVANTPPKNAHAASHPAITASVVCRCVSHTKQCRLKHAVKINACTTRLRPVAGSNDQTHATEVDLQLVARFAVDDPDRRPPAPGPAAHLSDVALHRPARNLDTAPSQQLVDLHRGEIVRDPRRDLVVVGHEHSPRLAVAVGAVRAHRLDNQADEHIGQLLVAAVADQPQRHRRIHIAAHRLAVEADQPLRRPDALAGQPQPQHLSNLEHSDLPERHSRLRNLADRTTATAPSAGPTKVDPSGPITGGEVVPSLALGWSHATGARHAQVVPCGWRATPLCQPWVRQP